MLVRDRSRLSSPFVVVFETRPRWAPELERNFDGEQVRIRTCRSMSDVGRELSVEVDGRQAGRVAVLELATAPADCLQFLGRVHERVRDLPVIVIGSLQMSELEWPIRELGARDWVLDTVSGEELARLCRRQFIGGK